MPESSSILAPSASTSAKTWEPPASIAVALPLPLRDSSPPQSGSEAPDAVNPHDIHVQQDELRLEDLYPILGATLRSAGFEQVDASALDRLARDFDGFFNTICAYAVMRARTRRVQIHDVVSTLGQLGDSFSLQSLRDFAHGPSHFEKQGSEVNDADAHQGEATRHERNLEHLAPFHAARKAERERRAQEARRIPPWAILGSGFLGSEEQRNLPSAVASGDESEDAGSDIAEDDRVRSSKRRRFAHRVPVRTPIQKGKVVPITADTKLEHDMDASLEPMADLECEEIPAWLPAFPDGHTWKRTSVFPQSTSTSLRPLELVELKLQHSRLTQQALARLIRSTDAARSGGQVSSRALPQGRSEAIQAEHQAGSDDAPTAPLPPQGERYGTRSRNRTHTQSSAQNALSVSASSPLSSPPPAQLSSGENALVSSDSANASMVNEPRKRAKLALRLRVGGSSRASNASEVFEGATFPAASSSMGPPMSSSQATLGGGTSSSDEPMLSTMPQSAMIPSSMLTPMFETMARARQRRSASVAFADPFGSTGTSPSLSRTGSVSNTPRGSTSGSIFWSGNEPGFLPRPSFLNAEPQTPATALLPSTPFIYPPTPTGTYASGSLAASLEASRNAQATSGVIEAGDEEDEALPQAVHYRTQKATSGSRTWR